MTLLPVVERELRLNAREAGTYRVRFLAALCTVLFCGFSLWLVTLFGTVPIPGRDLYLALTWITFVFVSIAGFSLTCDCISEEKREATLGLLFLTDLKGYDVILGKFSVAALRGIYALIATFPVLALPMLMGGTNLREFLRTAATLTLALLLSMTIGILTSTLLKRSWTSFALSAGILLLLALGLPLWSQFVRAFYRDPILARYFDLPSPSYALMMSFKTGWGLSVNDYALSLGLLAGMALVAVTGSSLIAPHIWKDRPPRRRLFNILELLREIKYGSTSFRRKFRPRLLEVNPIYWLSRRERVSSPGFMLLILALGTIAFWFSTRDFSRLATEAELVLPALFWGACAAITHLLIALRLSALAAERFGEDRRSGALELILSTPVSIKCVLSGHWRALRRYLAGPALAVVLLHFIVVLYALNLEMLPGHRGRGFAEIISEIFLHVTTGIRISDWEMNFGLLIMLGLAPVLVLNWCALSWMATWLSLRVKRALTAPILALAIVHLPPWLVLIGIAVILEENRWSPRYDFTHALLYYTLAAVLVVTHQLFCIAWSRRQLYRHFRTAATDRYQPSQPRPWWRRLARIH